MKHTDLQLLLAQTEKNYFETKLKLDRVTGEKQALLQENRILEEHRDDLRNKLRQVTQENVQIKERWVCDMDTCLCTQTTFWDIKAVQGKKKKTQQNSFYKRLKHKMLLRVKKWVK